MSIDDITKITILDLDLDKIKEYIFGYYADSRSSQLWNSLGGSDYLMRFWLKEREVNATSLFWNKEICENSTFTDALNTLRSENEAWRKMHSIGLLQICRNPYLLSIVCDIFDEDNRLPNNTGMLLETFVDNCLKQELTRKIELNEIYVQEEQSLKIDTREVMNQIAKLITSDKDKGTGITAEKGRMILVREYDSNYLDQCLLLAQGSTLLSVNEKEIRFAHQLVQEYFACQAIKDAFDNDYSPEQFFNKKEWWLPSGWEEPAIILTGILFSQGGITEVDTYLGWIAEAQPNAMIRCIERAGIASLSLATLNNNTKKAIQNMLVKRIQDKNESVESKRELARALGRFGDIRKGVGISINQIPDINFIKLGEDDCVSHFPITVEQFLSFVNARDGYQNIQMWKTNSSSLKWFGDYVTNGQRVNKWRVDFLNLHLNEPVVNINWYEATAFCCWLTSHTSLFIRLPSSFECERIIRNSNCEINHEISMLSPVGIFVAQHNREIPEDYGLIWEWCNDFCCPNSIPTCVLKGGSWRYGRNYRNSSYVFRTYPNYERDDIGFRVVSE